LTVASLGTTSDLIPGPFPFFSPREGSFTDNANLFR
jgi:hypothetical protein